MKKLKTLAIASLVLIGSTFGNHSKQYNEEYNTGSFSINHVYSTSVDVSFEYTSSDSLEHEVYYSFNQVDLFFLGDIFYSGTYNFSIYNLIPETSYTIYFYLDNSFTFLGEVSFTTLEQNNEGDNNAWMITSIVLMIILLFIIVYLSIKYYKKRKASL